VTKILRTLLVDAALVGAVVLFWRNPQASADAATQAYRWLDTHVRPLLQSPPSTTIPTSTAP
jgi:hypothetical protein